LLPQCTISLQHLAGNNSIIPYSPDLVPSDFHVFLHLNTFLGGWQFHDNSNVKEAVNTWFALQAVSLYDAGLQNLVPHYNGSASTMVETMSKNSVHQMTK
jgi:hypothetical protein